MTPEELARLFHETYEDLAPEFDYSTRRRSAVAWEEVPEDNKALMVETAKKVLMELKRRGLLREASKRNRSR